MQSVRFLLDGIVDYAGLFPPAELTMARAVEAYARSRTGSHGWMLGRFILPAARLEEFAVTAQPFLQEPSPWTLSALCKLPLDEDLRRIETFHRLGLAIEVDTLEVKATRPDEIRSAAKELDGCFTPYFEIPLSSEPSEFIDCISGTGARAKIRTGGVTPDSIPDSHSVARFILSCASRGVPFKATAGLHHPLHGLHRLIPDGNSLRAPMHGFLNVFLASAFAKAGAGSAEIIELLAESSPGAFTFENDSIRWRSHEATNEFLVYIRQTFAIAFGSCSFEEPVEDLKAMSLL